MTRSHYHAKNITVAQCPTEENKGEELELTYKNDGSRSRTLEGLPKIIARLGIYLSVRLVQTCLRLSAQ